MSRFLVATEAALQVFARSDSIEGQEMRGIAWRMAGCLASVLLPILALGPHASAARLAPPTHGKGIGKASKPNP